MNRMIAFIHRVHILRHKRAYPEIRRTGRGTFSGIHSLYALIHQIPVKSAGDAVPEEILMHQKKQILFFPRNFRKKALSHVLVGSGKHPGSAGPVMEQNPAFLCADHIRLASSYDLQHVRMAQPVL